MTSLEGVMVMQAIVEAVKLSWWEGS